MDIGNTDQKNYFDQFSSTYNRTSTPVQNQNKKYAAQYVDIDSYARGWVYYASNSVGASFLAGQALGVLQGFMTSAKTRNASLLNPIKRNIMFNQISTFSWRYSNFLASSAALGMVSAGIFKMCSDREYRTSDAYAGVPFWTYIASASMGHTLRTRLIATAISTAFSVTQILIAPDSIITMSKNKIKELYEDLFPSKHQISYDSRADEKDYKLSNFEGFSYSSEKSDED